MLLNWQKISYPCSGNDSILIKFFKTYLQWVSEITESHDIDFAIYELPNFNETVSESMSFTGEIYAFMFMKQW